MATKKAERAREASFQIATWTSKDGAVVKGTVRGLFGVSGRDDGYFTVTHLPTGYSVREGLSKRAAERLRGECLRARLNWRFTDARETPKSVKAWAQRVFKRYPRYQV